MGDPFLFQKIGFNLISSIFAWYGVKEKSVAWTSCGSAGLPLSYNVHWDSVSSWTKKN